MTKYQKYLINKYGTTEIRSRFEIAEDDRKRREDIELRRIEADKSRKQAAERIKILREQAAERIKILNKGLDRDEYWMQLNLPDGKVAIYKDGKAYDLDTGLPIEL